ncbi:hypothetical protein M514_25884 [Trichuris suis]|uniref:Uncharacterized protein n=1 Tax=Trichuris suis TaxID=68888 RepID=A0A085MXJ5_9BILA|nr:hypothetical protein M514_25884 [Trichuris suis]
MFKLFPYLLKQYAAVTTRLGLFYVLEAFQTSVSHRQQNEKMHTCIHQRNSNTRPDSVMGSKWLAGNLKIKLALQGKPTRSLKQLLHD